MKSPRWLTLCLSVGLVACSKPFPCTRYCWSHTQVVPDVAPPNGRFDATCDTSAGFEGWYPPLPPFGWYAAERCVDASVHSIIAKVAASIQDPAVDASQACDVTELQVYGDFVQALAQQARDACVAHVTCNGAPAGCDLDPFLGGNQACTVPSAEVLCDQVVLTPALAALTDLTNGPGAAQPERDGTAIEHVDDPAECQPLLQADTDDVLTCPESPPSTTGDGGVDDSTTGEGAAPFGDIESLVTCTSVTRCVVDPELFANVQRGFHVLTDDGIELEAASLPRIALGLRLTGLDHDDASAPLFAALGVEDGDVFTHVDGASLASPSTIEDLLLDLSTTRAWRLTLRRSTGSTWRTLELLVLRGP